MVTLGFLCALQSLVAKGWLQLVLWDGMSSHESRPGHRLPGDFYAHQVGWWETTGADCWG